MKKQGAKKVFILDDHPLMRQGIARLIDQEKDLIVCGEAGNAKEALGAISLFQPDLIILDISLHDSNGLEFLKDLRAQEFEMPVLVVSMHDQFLYAERALRAGANGYLMKNEPPQSLLAGIRDVLRGEIYITEKFGKKILRKWAGIPANASPSPLESLSDRELEVFRSIGQGLSTRQISLRMYRSTKTVETYRQRIRTKLGFKTGEELVNEAVQWMRHEMG